MAEAALPLLSHPLALLSIWGDLLDGTAWWNGGQHHVPRPGTLTRSWQQKWLRRRPGGVPCPGCLVLIGTYLTASIFLLKAEERIVSTIIPQRYIFQLYLELDTTVTLPAIASTPAPAVMNLKSLASRQQRESLQACHTGSRERDGDTPAGLQHGQPQARAHRHFRFLTAFQPQSCLS